MSHTSTSDSQGTIVLTPPNPTATVIFVHGLGDTANGWVDAMAMLAKSLPHVKFILPTATTQPVTMHMGKCMPSWYDIVSLIKSEDDGADGIEESRERLLGLINAEVSSGIPRSRIVLGGFSQGGVMSLDVGLQLTTPLAGVLCLSGYIPMIKSFALTPQAKDVPTLMCHGDIDSRVSFAWGQHSRDLIKKQGATNLEFRAYSGLDHCSCEEELEDIKQWLESVLPKDVYHP